MRTQLTSDPCVRNQSHSSAVKTLDGPWECRQACARQRSRGCVWEGGGGGNPVSGADGDGVGAVGGGVEERVLQGGVLPGVRQPPPAGHLALAALRIRLLGQHLCTAPPPARPAPPCTRAPLRSARGQQRPCKFGMDDMQTGCGWPLAVWKLPSWE